MDVRTPAEYRTRHIDGAVNISLQDIQRGVEAVDRAVGGARDRALVLYCRSGRRSSIAKRILGQAGFTRISDFGAINDWE
ncbi:MAG: sulfurtransferase [Proteobacteria bacterium]|nr:MAG: sulfurtransferase [Pseudomonadota bacterium]